MKPPIVVFVACLGMLACFVAAVILGEEPIVTRDGEPVALGHGFDHPDFAESAMQAGGDGEERHRRVLWIGWAYGALSIIFFIGALASGASKPGGLGWVRAPILFGGLIFVGIFTALIFSYRSYMVTETPDLVLQVPVPTAWMLYGIWLFPIFFILLYMYMFDRTFLTEDDLRRFEELVAERKAAQGD